MHSMQSIMFRLQKIKFTLYQNEIHPLVDGSSFLEVLSIGVMFFHTIKHLSLSLKGDLNLATKFYCKNNFFFSINPCYLKYKVSSKI